MFNGLVNKLHHVISSSPLLVKGIIMVRNQCNSIIKYYISNSPNSDENGENEIIQFLANECRQVIDIGANKGHWTAYFLKCNPEIKAFLYDPSEQASEYLKKSFSAYPGVSVINKAISDVSGEAVFFEEPDFGETSSLVHSFSSEKSRKTIVSVSTIDDQLKELNIARVDYLKIDVEGFDLHVLKGATASLENKKIDFLQFEYNKPWADVGSTLNYAINFLTSRGYDVFVLRKGGLYDFNYQLYGDFFEYANFFAVLREKRPKIEKIIAGAI